MKKLGLLVATFTLMTLSVSPVVAANKTSLLQQAFQEYLSDGEQTYQKALSDAKNLYEPQIASAQSKLSAALTQYQQVNQVTILKTTSHPPSAPVAIDAVNCPTSRSDCKDPTYKSNEFKAGEVATTYSFIGGDGAFSTSSWAQMNLGMLQTVDLEVKDGLIGLNNATAYSATVSTIRTQYQNILTLNQDYASEKSDAELAVGDVRDMKPTIAAAIKSAKRAAANPGAFEKAFMTSFKSEYNAQRLDELATMPWTYISSLKVLKDAVSVTLQSEKADAISAHYTDKSAAAMNAIYGNLFLSEEGYKNAFRIIASIYKATTGKTLSSK